MKSVLWILLTCSFASCVQARVMNWYGSEAVVDTAWLGEQPSSSEKEPAFVDVSEFDITLQVLPGDLVALQPTRNVTYWVVDGQRSEGMRTFAADRTYLMATIRSATPRAGRLQRCTVRILGGPLRGATVCIKPPDWVVGIHEPSYAVFEVPDSVVLHPGYVPFRVVEFRSK